MMFQNERIKSVGLILILSFQIGHLSPAFDPVFASEIYPYGSGYSRGCDDAGISKENHRFINQPQNGPSFQSKDFMRAYDAGFGKCFEKQEIKFVGFNVKQELSIGDLAAIGALISAPLIFYFGYSRKRKSEQFKLASSVMDDIYANGGRSAEFRLSSPIKKPSDDATDHELKSESSNFSEHFKRISSVCTSIEYFVYLVKAREIKDKEIIIHYKELVLKVINKLKEHYEELDRNWINRRPESESLIQLG